MVLPPREWICNNVTSRLPALLCSSVTMRWWKSFPVWTVLSRRMTELIPTVSMESHHFVDGLTSRDFSSIYTVRELLPDEVRSRLDGKWVFGKKRPLVERLWKFRCERIYAHAETRIVCKFCEIWPIRSRWNTTLLTWQKNWQVLLLSLMCGSRPKSVMHRKVFPIVSKASSLSNNELRDITRSPRRVPTA